MFWYSAILAAKDTSRCLQPEVRRVPRFQSWRQAAFATRSEPDVERGVQLLHNPSWSSTSLYQVFSIKRVVLAALD